MIQFKIEGNRRRFSIRHMLMQIILKVVHSVEIALLEFLFIK